MPNRCVVAWLLLAVAACGDNRVGANPPAPAVDPEIPPEIEAALEHDDQGRPILIETRSMLSPDEKIALVFDKDVDDPVTRYAWCLERVAACHRANPGSPVSGCIDQIQRCADNKGGRACCAPACVAEFHRQRGLGLSEKEAISASFVRGDCLDGLAALRGGT